MNASTKQPAKSSVIPGLISLLAKIPHGEQHALLNELEERFPKLKREHTRKTIRSNVECITNSRFHKGIITNISSGGVFIETLMPFRAGEDIVLRFMFPQNPQKQIQLTGQIVRISPFGVGVRFKRLSRDQELLIASHCGAI
jgi:Tfp pilus assembly protein PilZ